MRKPSYPEGHKNLSPPYTPSMRRDPSTGTYIPMYNDKTAGQRVVAIREEASGDVNEVSVPHLPYESWIDAQGGQINLVISTNRNPSQLDSEYRELARRRMLSAGGFPYEYALANQYAPYLTAGVTEEQWPARREKEQTKLRTMSDRRGRMIRDRSQTELERLLEAGKLVMVPANETNRNPAKGR
jgi:hypothetical protein